MRTGQETGYLLNHWYNGDPLSDPELVDLFKGLKWLAAFYGQAGCSKVHRGYWASELESVERMMIARHLIKP